MAPLGINPFMPMLLKRKGLDYFISKTNKEKNLNEKKNKQKTNETAASGEKRKDKCKTTRIFRLYQKQGVFSTKDRRKTR
jgi:hypothetical protein